MLRIADILALPGLHELRLRAGAAGLDHVVRWPYVAENEGIADWVMGGELVFVTGINHPRQEANLLQLVREAHQQRVAGMVILTGEEFIRAIPVAVVAEAERLSLPLLEQPYQLKMVVVTQAIGTALVQAQMLGRSRQHVLEQLLEGGYQSLEVLLQRARSLALPLAVPRQLALFRLAGGEQLFTDDAPLQAESRLQGYRQQLHDEIEQVVAGLGDALALICQGEHWIALLPAADAQQGRHNRQRMQALLVRANTRLAPLRLFLGLSATGHLPQHYAAGLGEARQALVVAQSFPERLGLSCFGELGVLELLSAVRDRQLLDRFVAAVLGALIHDDGRHSPVLMPTLEAWLQCNGNLALAAQRLQVHRNTLGYRLQRIETLTGRSLGDHHHRLDLTVALMIWRLSAYQPAPA
ncbi:PucR family transcriptional regulator [Corticibacter populi]|uniref:PucR family transcriptional regulator n=1 Tax=Corticibacter populi TaxID=1550736 RepID=A0A3M6QQ57_9BURK|nr:PucR family transcriptional regulator [Corticibacter populi]RMX04931.1 PucR family transcriptional regulator [Corticibacter populi]RZS33644.1 sugar diacid utilization regulator [Corticibacter populi]